MVSRTTQQTARSRVMTWQYDDSGRIARFANVDGTTEAYGYDAANNQIRQTIHNPNKLAGHVVTYHPAALLRNPAFKAPCWEDMKKLMALLKDA